MSGGGSDTTTTTNTPPSWLTNAGNFAGQQGQDVYNSVTQGGYNPLQQGAASASGYYGSLSPGALGLGANTYAQNAQFQPNTDYYGLVTGLLGQGGGGGYMSGGGGGGYSQGGNAVNMDPSMTTNANPGLVDTSQLQQVQAGQLANTNLQPYMNPFQQSVIDTTMQGLDQNLQLQQQQNAGNAAAAGAFGGTRQAVQAALTNQAGQQTAASTLAGLNSQNFSQAQQAALSDIGNNLNASEFNSGQLAQMLGLNATNTQATNLANSGAANQILMANAQNATSRYGSDAQRAAAGMQAAATTNAARFNSQASMHNSDLDAALGLAQLAQNGSIQGAGVQNQSAAGLMGLGQQGIADMTTWGNQMYQQPMQNLGWYTGMLGPLAGGAGYTNTTTSPGANPWAGALGLGATALGAYFGSGG